MADETEPTFGDMARTFPVRTGLLTGGPLVLAAVQLLAAVFYGGSVVVSALFAVGLAATVIGLTRWQLATFRRRTLVRKWG